MDDLDLAAEEAFMANRYAVSDEQLVARVRVAADMGGAALVDLSEVVLNQEQEGIAISALR